MVKKPSRAQGLKPLQPGIRGSIRESILARKPKPRPRNWFEKLEASEPAKAAEILQVIEEWQDKGSEVSDAYPTRNQLYTAIAKECGVSYQAVKAVFLLELN
jgi:hypothetical protein